MNEDLIIKHFRYFSRFVPLKVLKEIMVQPEKSRLPGYSEINAEILIDSEPEIRIPEINKFICSMNEKFISERIKNSKGFILFVEYGNITADFGQANGVKGSIGVTVVHNFNDSNNDNANEVILMNSCLEILMKILMQIIEDQNELCMKLITMPVEIQVVDPVLFYGCGGWSATFNNSTTITS